MRQTIRLLGLDFDDLSLDQAVRCIAERPATAPFGYVVTPNADHLVRLHRDGDLLPIYRDAWLCLLDSRVVSRLARALGLPAPPVAAGSDLTELILSRHLPPGERIGIIGVSPVWLPALMARYDLASPAHYDPPSGFERDFTDIVAFLRAHPARLVFLAVGSPRQERLAAALRAAGITGTGLCIGASLDFLCGARRRAPRLMRHCGLEWLWRLAREPRRLARRYLLDSPRVIGLLLTQRFSRPDGMTSSTSRCSIEPRCAWSLRRK